MVGPKIKDEGVIIRGFRIEDYDQVISLWKISGIPYKPRGRDQRSKIMEEMRRPNTLFWVAEKEGRIVASVLGTHDGRKGWINRLAVLPEYRLQGIALQLVKAVEDRLHEWGIEIIACLVEEDNPVSMKFFKRLGYAKHPGIIYFSKRKHPEV